MNPAIILESFLHGIESQNITNFFIIVLIALFALAFVLARFGRGQNFVNYAPTMFTSLGILGTFVGIIVGLLDFQVEDINASIGPLLGGLKTAFITSLAGMTLAIVFKGGETSGLFRSKKLDEEIREVGPENIYEELRAQRGAMEKLTRAIVGDEESTLITQIRLLRSDSRDEAKDRKQRFELFTTDLWKKLDDFAQMLSKSATEQVINALKEVIVDFNRNLTEQFGENFKELNAAVEKLVQWQEDYRLQLAQMIKQYEEGVQAITQIETAVAHISEESKQIPVTMGALKTVLEATQHQINELERHLEAFRDMRDRAIEAVPQIQEQMDAMVKDVSTAVKDAGEQIMMASQEVNTAIVDGAKQLVTNSEEISKQWEDTVNEINDQVRNMIKAVRDNTKTIAHTLVESNESLNTNIKEVQFQVTDSIETMQKHWEDLLDKTTDSIDTTQKRLESALDEVFRAQTDALSKTFGALDDEIRETVKRTGETVTKQLGAMDEAMEEELNRVIGNLAKHLAAITTKFTEDYSHLTEQMAQVVARPQDFERRQREAR